MPTPEPTHFLNVDLDIEGRARELAALCAELEARLLVLNSEIHRGRRFAHYEVRSMASTVEGTLGAFLRILEGLGPAPRRGWRAARRRDFNVGPQAGRLPHAAEYAVAPRTLARVAALEARLVVTVYAPFPRPRGAKA